MPLQPPSLTPSTVRPKPNRIPQASSLSWKTWLFYSLPLISKWRKAFKTPSVLVVSDIMPDLPLLSKKLKPSFIQHMSIDDWQMQSGHDPVECIIMVMSHPPVDLISMIPHLHDTLVPGGVFLYTLPRPPQAWQAWQRPFLDHGFTDLYTLGFHPQGAVAWWPFESKWLTPLGHVVDTLMTFFPGRYELGLTLGRYWLVRGFKRNNRTELV